MTEFLTRTEVQAEVDAWITKHELAAEKRLVARKEQEKEDRHDKAKSDQKILFSIDSKIETKLSTIAFRWYVWIFIAFLSTIIWVIYWSQMDNKEDIVDIKISQARMVEKQSQISEKVDLIYDKIVKWN